MWGIVVFGIVTLANLHIFLRQYSKDRDLRALTLRSVVIVGSVVGSVLAYNVIQSLRAENQSLNHSLAAVTGSLAPLRAAATMEIMRSGGGL